MDIEDGTLYWRNPNKYHKEKKGNEAGWVSNNGYRRVKVEGKSYPVHHIIWFLYYNRWPKQDIDHINGVKSFNGIINLREVSRKDNCKNTPARNTNKLGVKHIRLLSSKYQVRVNGKSFGVYDTLDQAIKVRDSVEKLCMWENYL